MQSSFLFNPTGGKICSSRTVQCQQKQGQKGLLMGQGEEGKGKKGVSDSTLTRMASTGLLVMSLGGFYSMNRSSAMDEALPGLGEKVTEPQITQIKKYKTEMANGDTCEMVGVGIVGASLGCLRERESRRKDKKSEPSR